MVMNSAPLRIDACLPGVKTVITQTFDPTTMSPDTYKRIENAIKRGVTGYSGFVAGIIGLLETHYKLKSLVRRQGTSFYYFPKHLVDTQEMQDLAKLSQVRLELKYAQSARPRYAPTSSVEYKYSRAVAYLPGFTTASEAQKPLMKIVRADSEFKEIIQSYLDALARKEVITYTKTY